MDKNLQTIVEGVGFEPKEALVYLACLELDGDSNTAIARKTKLNRITNYEILKRLERRRIVTSFLKRNTKYFTAVDPRILIKQAKERIALAEASTPELLAMANKLIKKPRIYFFEGIEGIKTIYDDSLNAKTDILTFTNAKDIYELLGKAYLDAYVQERIKRKISVKSLTPGDQIGKEEKEISAAVLRETHIFPPELYAIRNEIMIYDDKIAIFSGKDEMGVIIENKVLADSFRNIWKMAQDNAEKFN